MGLYRRGIVGSCALVLVAGLLSTSRDNAHRLAQEATAFDHDAADAIRTDERTIVRLAGLDDAVVASRSDEVTPALALADAAPLAMEAVVAQAEPVTPAPEDASSARETASPRPAVMVASLDPSVYSSAAPQEPAKVELAEECLVASVCIDRFLWALYERAPKEDTIRISERIRVAVRRKGKTVIRTRTVSRLADEDFGWKDPKAAARAGLAMMDYVIGGMERGFRTKLFHALHAAEQAGLAPGITSGFRDDYRQSIASGLKAATNRSFHGGSLRGGYGHGLAADIVSVNGATRAERWVATERLWRWIDANGPAFGIGRPYLGRDPPHVGPVDGNEYVSRRGRVPVEARSASAKVAAN